MMKLTFSAVVILFILTGCTALKQAGSRSNQQLTSNTPQPDQQGKLKFLEIDVAVEKSPVKNQKQPVQAKKPETSENTSSFVYPLYTSSGVEVASPLQIKYAILLNTEVEEVKNLKIFEYIDEWYGTRYCLGGTTKTCIDCSAFVQLFFTAVYGASLPRTARDQYRQARKISRTEIKEGDLLFFNTRGGISHVGIYLQNNKFVHASTSGGVMISDMFDPYWAKKMIGAGRINKESLAGAQ